MWKFLRLNITRWSPYLCLNTGKLTSEIALEITHGWDSFRYLIRLIPNMLALLSEIDLEAQLQDPRLVSSCDRTERIGIQGCSRVADEAVDVCPTRIE
jgi:hypothetical protein